MSLTSFLRENKDVRDRFRIEFKKPKFVDDIDLKASPQSNRYSLVGTAFDYLLRFYLERLNENAVVRRWVAELAISHPLSPILNDVEIDGESGRILSFRETELTSKVQRMIDDARSNYGEYLSDGRVADQLIHSCLCLAQLDPIVRAGVIDPHLGIVHKEDVADLHKLIEIVDPGNFVAKEICLLNPTLGEGSSLVGGADADLFIDGRIIDIKTTKNFELPRRSFDQLIGYYTLHHIGGIGELDPKPQVSRLGNYFSRHAYLYEFDVSSVIGDFDFLAFVEWFKQRADNEFASLNPAE